jgi:glutathione synthase/RimK-type ligase-like ATP-grasp enzyme
MTKIYIVTSRINFFGRGRRGWETLDLMTFKRIFSEIGDVKILNIDELTNLKFESSDVLLIGGDPDLMQQRYHLDILEHLVEKYNVDIYPRLALLKAHENKGNQELLKERLGIQSLNGVYLNSLEAAKASRHSYPVVYKKTTGAGSSGVSLVHNYSELATAILKNSPVSTIDKLKLAIRKLKYSPAEYAEYEKSKIRIVPFVLQPFVPNLKHDYKVLCFGDRYYCLKRYVRDNDFRASGSGKLDFERAPVSLVEYAREMQQLLNPIVSLDICWDGTKHELIEFQACHFGPSTLTKSEGYYQFDGEWKYIDEKSDLTEVFCNAYVDFINKRR